MIMEKIMNGDAKSLEEIIAQLKEEMPEAGIDVELVTQKIGFDSEREQEIFDAFNKIFNEAGLGQMVVPALAELCQMQMENSSVMDGRSGETLAKMLLRKYQAQ